MYFRNSNSVSFPRVLPLKKKAFHKKCVGMCTYHIGYVSLLSYSVASPDGRLNGGCWCCCDTTLSVKGGKQNGKHPAGQASYFVKKSCFTPRFPSLGGDLLSVRGKGEKTENVRKRLKKTENVNGGGNAFSGETLTFP